MKYMLYRAGEKTQNTNEPNVRKVRHVFFPYFQDLYDLYEPCHSVISVRVFQLQLQLKLVTFRFF